MAKKYIFDNATRKKIADDLAAKKARDSNSNSAKSVDKNKQPMSNYTPTEGFIGNYQMNTGKEINNMKSTASDFGVIAGNLIENAYAAQDRADQFNANQAQLNRDWQERMSATAHQREVADLKAAGLNPVLSVNAGAPVGSGATASSSNALTGVLGELAGLAMNAVSNLSQAVTSNTANVYSMLEQQRTAKQNADVSFNASKYSSDVAKYAADLSSQTQLSMNQANLKMQKYVAELNSLTNKEVARIAGEYNVKTTKMNNFIQQNAAELSYLAALKTNAASNYTSLINTAGTNANQMMMNIRDNATKERMTTQSNEVSFFNNLISSICGLVPG